MTVETMDEKKNESEAKIGAKAKVCEFTGYLNDAGKIVIKPTSEECRDAIIEAGKEMGVDVELETPKVPCEPCKEAAKRFLSAMQTRKAAKTKEFEFTTKEELSAKT
jgi:hypothetical protein